MFFSFYICCVLFLLAYDTSTSFFFFLFIKGDRENTKEETINEFNHRYNMGKKTIKPYVELLQPHKKLFFFTDFSFVI